MKTFEQMQAERAAQAKKAARKQIFGARLLWLVRVVFMIMHTVVIMLVLGLVHEHFAAVPALGFRDTALVLCGVLVVRMIWFAEGVWQMTDKE